MYSRVSCTLHIQEDILCALCCVALLHVVSLTAHPSKVKNCSGVEINSNYAPLFIGILVVIMDVHFTSINQSISQSDNNQPAYVLFSDLKA